MIRSLASLLLLLGLLAMPGATGAEISPSGPSGIKAEAVLDAAMRGADTAEPGDEPLAAPLRRGAEPPLAHARHLLRPRSTLAPLHDYARFRARAPPTRNVQT